MKNEVKQKSHFCFTPSGKSGTDLSGVLRNLWFKEVSAIQGGIAIFQFPAGLKNEVKQKSHFCFTPSGKSGADLSGVLRNLRFKEVSAIQGGIAIFQFPGGLKNEVKQKSHFCFTPSGKSGTDLSRVLNSLRNEHDLAYVFAGFHQAVGLGGFGQRQCPVDDRCNFAGFQQRPHVLF